MFKLYVTIKKTSRRTQLEFLLTLTQEQLHKTDTELNYIYTLNNLG